MSSEEFRRDNAFSKKYRPLFEILYKPICYDGRFVFIEKSQFSTLVQMRLKTDVVWQIARDASIGVEEKIVRWPGYAYEAFCLETESCTVPGRESPGWMVDGAADYLLYAFERPDALLVYIMDFPRLKTWFWRNYQKYPEFQMKNTINRTRGRKVDIKDVKFAVPCINCRIHLDGSRRKNRDREIIEWWKGMERQQQMFAEIESIELSPL